jgi:hypothetical protein
MTAGSPVNTSERDPSLVADIGQWLYGCFCVPGDYVLTQLVTYAPSIARLHAVVPPRGTGWAALISALIWIGGIVLAIAVYRALRDLHVTVCGYAARFYGGWARIGRNVARRQKLALKSSALTRRSKLMQPMISEEVELGEFVIAVLRCHSRLPPGHTLTVSDVARVLRVRMSQAESALARLQKLQLVDTAVGGGDGESSYRLSLPGQLFLATYDRGPA